MPSVYQRTNKDGTKVWRAVVRIKGYPTVCDHFKRKQEDLDWSHETARQIKLGKYNFGKQNQKKTIADLIDSYLKTVLFNITNPLKTLRGILSTLNLHRKLCSYLCHTRASNK